jgi:hypothetical protein
MLEIAARVAEKRIAVESRVGECLIWTIWTGDNALLPHLTRAGAFPALGLLIGRVRNSFTCSTVYQCVMRAGRIERHCSLCDEPLPFRSSAPIAHALTFRGFGAEIWAALFSSDCQARFSSLESQT